MIKCAMITTSLRLFPGGTSQPQDPLTKAVDQAAGGAADRWLPSLELWIEQVVGVATWR